MSIPRSVVWIAALLGIALIASTEQAVAQNSSNPYAMVAGWAKLPGGREMGAVGKVTIDPDGRHIWAVIRCDAGGERFGNECLDSDLDVALKFDPDGNVVESFGGGMFIWPHGIDVDSDGNVWVTDGVSSGNIPEGDNRGHRVIKFSPRGEVLMTLGTGGEEGGGRDHFTSPSDVAVAENGDVFVADGHGNAGNNRVVKFNRRGEYVMSWGQTGYARASSVRSTPSTSTRAGGSSWEIAATAGSRSSTSRGITSPAGPNSGVPAESPSTITD